MLRFGTNYCHRVKNFKAPIIVPKIGAKCLRYFLRRTGRPHGCGPVALRTRVATGLLFSKILILQKTYIQFKTEKNVSVLSLPGNREVKNFPVPLKTLHPLLQPLQLIDAPHYLPGARAAGVKLIVSSVDSYAAQNFDFSLNQ